MKTYLLLFLTLISSTLKPQQNNNEQSIVDTLITAYELFESEKPLQITIKSDFKKFRRKKAKGEYQEAELSYFLTDTTTITHKITIRARGKNRRETCTFPPIKINLKKLTKDGKNLRFSKLKMVVHCGENKAYEKYILKEYLCYKLYSNFSPKSFRVQLLDVRYIDTGTKKQKETRKYAFLIEDQNMMAERLNAVLEKNLRLTQKHVNQENIMQLAMFQFMIGNFDWAVPTQQNLKLIRPKATLQEIYAVPYDFDYSGMVNANYAIPNEALGIGSVRQRLYLGECKPVGNFLPIMDKFKKNKNNFYKVIQSFNYLDEKDKQIMVKYLDQFYKQLYSKGFYNNYIRKGCKEIKD